MNVYPRAHWYLVLGFVVAVAGFIPSYWSQDLGTFGVSIHVHAASATLWFLALIVQPWLINAGNLKAHRIFGSLALLIAVVLTLTAALITPRNLQLQAANPNLPYMFVYWDITTISLFAIFVTRGMKHRRDVQLHARFMVGTVFVPILPALARGLFFYGVVENFVSALYVGNMITLTAIAVLIHDDDKQGQLRSPYRWLFGVFAVLGTTIEIVGSAAWWQTLVDAAVVPLTWAVLLVGAGSAALLGLQSQRSSRVGPDPIANHAGSDGP